MEQGVYMGLASIGRDSSRKTQYLDVFHHAST